MLSLPRAQKSHNDVYAVHKYTSVDVEDNAARVHCDMCILEGEDFSSWAQDLRNRYSCHPKKQMHGTQPTDWNLCLCRAFSIGEDFHFKPLRRDKFCLFLLVEA